MIQAIWTNIRRRRTAAAVIAVVCLLSVVFYLSGSVELGRGASARRGASIDDNRPCRGLLVTTPGDEHHPFHYLPLDSAKPGFGDAIPVKTGINPGSKQGVSHLVRHPTRDELVYTNNEIRPGSVWTGKLERRAAGLELAIFGQDPTNGDLPAYSIVSRDGSHLLVANYGSSTIAVYIIGSNGQLHHTQTVNLPRPAWIKSDALPHPHHISQHPTQPIYYVPDLGWDVVYVLRARYPSGPVELEVTQTYNVSSYGEGARNGVVSADGRTFYLSFQTSSTLIAIPLDAQGSLLSPRSGAITTLPSEVLEEGPTTNAGEIINSSSDILLYDNLVFVANRRVKGPYPAYKGDAEDTIAVFEASGTRLRPRGHIYTGCWKPREMTRVKGEQKDYLAVTCNGQFAQGGGVVLFDMSAEPYIVVDRWDSGRVSVSGLVGLSTGYTSA